MFHLISLSLGASDRKKMKISSAPSNDPTNLKDTSVEPSKEPSDGKVTKDSAITYVSLLKKTITSAEFILFKNAMKQYKQEGKLKDVTSTLDIIMLKYMEHRPELLTGFKVFIKKHHLGEFEKFCIQAKEESKEINQVFVK